MVDVKVVQRVDEKVASLAVLMVDLKVVQRVA